MTVDHPVQDVTSTGSVAASARTLAGKSAAELARMIRSGMVSARETVDAHIARIEEVNDRLNAVVVPLFGQARAAADAADASRRRGETLAPLHGVPITIKEQLRVAGSPTTLGVVGRRTPIATDDGPLVARLRRAGAVILGTTNVAQLLFGIESDNPLYGRTNNPWDLGRTPAGSSGGEAAIVSAGGSALGIGADFGGSLRLPAHFCGLATLKPTSGRLTDRDTPSGVFAYQEAILPQVGPLAHSVEDVRLAMSVLAAPGQEEVDPAIAPVPWRDAEIPVADLGIGYYEDDGFLTPSPAIRRAVREGAAALRAAGARVVEWRPPDVSEAVTLFQVLSAPDRFDSLRRALRGERVDRRLATLLQQTSLPPGLLPLVTRFMAAGGQLRTAKLLRDWARWSGFTGMSSAQYAAALDARSRYRGRFLTSMREQGIDVLICPPYALPALTHGASGPLFLAASYTFLFNLVGLPAGVVPVTTVRPGEESDRPASRDAVDRTAAAVERGSAGLPVGVQVVARLWREDMVLSVMGAIERRSGATIGRPPI